MALSELQIPTKENFYNKIRSTSTQINGLINKWKDLSEFIGLVETVDLDTMGVPVGDIRTDLLDFRIMINEAVEFFEGGTVVPTKNPSEVIDKLRTM